MTRKIYDDISGSRNFLERDDIGYIVNWNGVWVRCEEAGGARWNASSRCWTISEDMLPQARKIMMDVYGYTDEEQSETITVKATFAKDVWEECDSVVILGKTVARAYGRDTGAKPGEDVLFLEGAPTSGGSRANWRSIVRTGSVVTLYNVSKTLYDAKKDSLPEGVSVEIIEEEAGERKEEKAVDEAMLEECGRRAEHVMKGKNPEIIAIAKKTIQDAYSRKAEAKDKVEEEKVLAFASGVLYGLYQLKMIEEDKRKCLEKSLESEEGKMEKELCKTWKECLKWADISLRDRNRMEVEDEGDEKWRVYLMHPLYVHKKILWKEGSESWDRLSKDAWSYVDDLEEKGVDVYALNADYWGEWVSDHEREYMKEAYDGNEFKHIVRDVAEELADDLGIKVDEE